MGTWLYRHCVYGPALLLHVHVDGKCIKPSLNLRANPDTMPSTQEEFLLQIDSQFNPHKAQRACRS